MTRPAPGELVWRYPDCPLCGEETDGDGDSFHCNQCKCNWGNSPQDQGEWDEPYEHQCPTVLDHERHPILSGRCVLTEDHPGYHNNDRTSWPV